MPEYGSGLLRSRSITVNLNSFFIGISKMKAYLIDAQNKAVESVDVGSMEDIVKMIGYDTIESEAVGSSGDRLFFDEECFIRGSEGRFKLDKLIPVSGKGLLVGSNEDGGLLSDVNADESDLISRVTFS